MPTAPRLTVPGVSPAPLPGVRVAPTQPALGPDFSGPINALGGIVQEEQQKADAVRVNDADNQATVLRDRVLYGEPGKPETGLLGKRGQNAFGGAEQAITQWNEGLSQIGSSLNDRQKLSFHNRIVGYDHNLHLEIQAHVLKERTAYDQETTNGYITNRVQDAARAFTDEKTVDRNLDLAIAALKDHAVRNGMPAEWTQSESAKLTSGVRLDVVKQLLSAPETAGGGDLRAGAYLAAHRGEFIASHLEVADRLTDAGSVRGESQRTADSILKSATTLSDALGKAALTTDPQVREATERRVRQHFADLAASDRDARNGAFTRASQAIQKGATLDQLPLADRVLLSPDEYLQLDHVSQRIRNPVVETKPSYYTHWMNQASLNPDTQQDFLNHDFGADRAAGKISEADYHRFESLKLQLRHRDEAADARADRASEAQTTRLRRGEEAQVFKQGKALLEYDRTSVRTDSLFKGAMKSPRPKLTIPRWMVDSAQSDPEYRQYLKFHGVDVDSAAQPAPTPAPNAQSPKAPGAPIIR